MQKHSVKLLNKNAFVSKKSNVVSPLNKLRRNAKAALRADKSVLQLNKQSKHVLQKHSVKRLNKNAFVSKKSNNVSLPSKLRLNARRL